ncbi:glycoside hydrolase family 2 protein [Halorarum halobium]|uniref:COG1470 family protein n=1 Tax=Halorarum halobium TaxID=3075121 RepID=UPI0028AB6645|nr:glycoside hydrolase family 2 protein [Halobaculum sp. XH14]
MVPDEVDRNVSAYNQHEFEFSFTNQDSSRKIYNVTLENTSYLTWEQNKFNLNASQTRTVNALFYIENITTINDTLESSYKYSGSDNDFSGPNISIEVSTFYRNTSISVEPFETSFELPFGESDSSVFRVENTGTKTAFNVTVEGEDVEFSRNSFDVAPGEDVLVQYNVSIPKPDSNATAATNQTYSRTVQVSGENFNQTEFTASVFVPFKQYDTEEAEEEAIDTLVQFCSDNPEATICSGEQIVKWRNNTKYVNNTSIYRANFTEEQLTALQVLANTRAEDYQDILQRVRLQQNTFRSELQKTRSNFSENLGEVENETQQNTRMIRSLNETINEYGERQLQEARNRTFYVQLGVGIIVFYLVGRGCWWIYVNRNELTQDEGWS